MKTDVSLVLFSGVSFCIGLIIYYLLTLLKVHVLLYEQPQILATGSAGMQPGVIQRFRSHIFSSSLHKATVRYIFRYRSQEWIEIDNKHVKSWLNIINGLVTFLKPYLVVAAAWIFIGYWIDSRLFYEPLTLTLGQLQQKLYFISNIPIVKALKEHKTLVLFLYGLVCIFIPYMYAREAATKKVKKYFSNTLLYLALLGNISFFGVFTGEKVADNEGQLKNLKAEVVSMHNSIYLRAASVIATNDLEDAIEEEEAYENEVARLDAIAKDAATSSLDLDIRDSLVINLVQYASRMRQSYTLDVNSIEVKPGNPPRYKNAYQAVNSYYEEKIKPASIANESSFEEYFTRPEQWNKQQGTKILERVDAVIAEMPATKSVFRTKVEKVLGLVFDFGLDISVSDFFERLNISEQKPLKKIVSLLLTENYKNCFVKQATNLLGAFKDNASKARQYLSTKCGNYPKSPAVEYEQFVTANDNFFTEQKLIADNKSLERSVLQSIDNIKIELPPAQEIVERLNFETGGNYTEDDLLKVLNEDGFKGSTLDEAITNMEKDAYKQILLEEMPGEIRANNRYLAESAELIADAASNMDIISRLAGSGAAISRICPRCGLPLSFPVCLRVR